MAELRIKVGASVDRDLGLAYRPLVDAANRAAAAISAAGKKGGQAVSTETRKGTSAAETAYAKLIRETTKWEKEAVRSADKASKAAQKAANDEVKAKEHAVKECIKWQEKATRERLRDNERILRDVARIEKAEEAAAAKAARADGRSTKASAKRWGGRADAGYGAITGVARSAYRAASGIAGDLARGAGVQLDFGSLVRSGVDLETQAVDLANAGYMPGKGGANGQRQSSAGLISQVRQVALSTGTSSGDAMGGLQAFVGKTGDLETGRAVLGDLAKLSKATGANLGDMVDAAGDVANALGNIPNKGVAVQSVMAAIAAQGKEGAVEIKDLATQMAKLGAASGQFSGGTAEVMSWMGALTQMTRAKGGAASATQAATSLGSFTASFSKGARRSAFDKAGVALEDSTGKIRNPRDIIIDALRATGGKTEGMGKMFADAGARRVTRGFESIYKEAGGGEKGLDAVRKAFDDLANAVVHNKEVDDSFALSMATAGSKATVFNEKLGAVTDELKSNLLPMLHELSPLLLGAVKSFSDWVAKKTGKDKADEVSADFGTEMNALNANTVLAGDVRSGKADQKDVDQAHKAKTALAEALEKKRKTVEQEGEESYTETTYDKDGPTGVTVTPFSALDPKTLEALSSQDSLQGARAKRYVEDEKQLKGMADTLGKLDNTLYLAMQRALEGGLKITNVDDFLVRPSIVTPDEGRQAPPGKR